MLRPFVLLSSILIACGSRPAAVETVEPAPAPVATPAGTPAPTTWADTSHPFETLSRGWNRIPGRPGSGCAEDSVYAFRVRPGLPDKVLIYLNGGGMCWRGGDCEPKGRPTYTTNADSANDVSVRAGLFDVANESNPVREYTMVFVSYCTGDAHLGTRTVTYQRDGKRRFEIRHEGAENLETALDWVFTNLRNPRTVLVAGVDAGAIASPVVAAKVARRYPRARVIQLGDGAGALRGSTAAAAMEQWGAASYLRRDPAFRSVAEAPTFERLYVAAGRAAPRVQFAQVNSIDDPTQLAQLTQLGVKGQTTGKLLTDNLNQLRAAVPQFHSYTIPTRMHTILRSNAMYTTTVGGVSFREWLADLLNGESVADVGRK